MGFRERQEGFSLVEVVIAVGIAAFCLVVMLGLIPAGMNSNKDSSGETAAANIARNIFSDLRATPKSINTSVLYGITLPSSSTPLTNSPLYFDDAGSTNSSTSPRTKYRATVILTSTPPTITVGILITWPAGAAPSTAPGRYEIETAIDRRYP